jgi:asparagine synthase (glutamine-hydrolysing)
MGVCGICGTAQSDGEQVIKAMNATMRHRGPDDEGIYMDARANLGLGARRLSIIDLEGGHQPLANEDRSVWAVLNGEIYNFPALRGRLLAAGHSFATRSDTEVLVHLYEEYGIDLVHALEGMYVFAIWDAARGRLLVARDRFGEKPLFYSATGGNLVFASELTALLAVAPSGWEIDPAVVDAFFVYGYVPGSAAIVRGIRQLEPGHMLLWEVDSRRPDVRRYWAPPFFASDDGTPVRDLVEETRELLERSVRARLISDVPVGVFLSGGIDSTLVAVLAARSIAGPLKTYTVGYEVGSVDERASARKVAALIDADHHELVVTTGVVRDAVPAMLSRVDQPIADQAFAALEALAHFARRDVKVAVGGEGADELFAGYPRYRWLARGARLPAWLPRDVPARVAARVSHVPKLGRLARMSDLLSGEDTLQRHLEWVSDHRSTRRAELYGPRLRELTDSKVLVDDAGADVGQDVVGSLMRLDLLHWLPGDVLMKADRATMRASLELRTPYLSRELAEFAASVPSSVHVKHGGKMLLRRLAHDLVPARGYDIRKTAFRSPCAQWLRGPLLPKLREQVSESALYSDGWFDRGTVGRLVERHRSGQEDLTNTLWPVFALACWYDAHVARNDG